MPWYAKKSDWAEARAREFEQKAREAREQRVPTFAPAGKVRRKMTLVSSYSNDARRMRQLAERLRSKGQ